MVETHWIEPIERLIYLKTLPGLRGLTTSDLALIARHVRERHFRKGSILLREGEPVDSFYIVVEGEVRIGPPECAGRRVGPRESVGLLELLAGWPGGLEALAVTDALALELDADALSEVCEERFSIFQQILRNLSHDAMLFQKRLPDGTLRMFGDDPEEFPEHRLDLVERLIALRRTTPFVHASLDALAELSRLLSEVRLDQGDTLWIEGQPADYLVLVLAGRVRCRIPSTGSSFLAGPGIPLGIHAAVCGLPHWHDAAAETRTLGLRIEMAQVLDILEDHFEMAMDLLRAIAFRVLEGLLRLDDCRGVARRHGKVDLSRGDGFQHTLDAPVFKVSRIEK